MREPIQGSRVYNFGNTVCILIELVCFFFGKIWCFIFSTKGSIDSIFAELIKVFVKEFLLMLRCFEIFFYKACEDK